MRLIDADAMIKHFDLHIESAENARCFSSRDAWDGAKHDLQDAEVIDAVPVVRCKDCKHWGTGYGGETENVKVCEYANYMVGKNGYCVYGERKMEAEVQYD